MNTHRRHFLQLSLLCGASSILGWRLLAASDDESNWQAYELQKEWILPLFTKKKAPGPNDWLTSHPEKGQTFVDYRSINPNRPNAERTKIYLQQIGEFTDEQEKVIKTLQQFMAIIFGLEVKMLPIKGLDKIPEAAQRKNPLLGQRQLLTTYILDQLLKPERPVDAVAVLAISNVDLWPGKNWNFVFGQASLVDRVGVWSIARMCDPMKEAQLFMRRVLQVAVHETGHIFGIKHCIAYECCMNGANHQDESDAAPLVFCAECDAKLWWACGLDAAKRAKELAAFAQEHKLSPDTEQWEKIATALKKKR